MSSGPLRQQETRIAPNRTGISAQVLLAATRNQIPMSAGGTVGADLPVRRPELVVVLRQRSSCVLGEERRQPQSVRRFLRQRDAWADQSNRPQSPQVIERRSTNASGHTPEMMVLGMKTYLRSLFAPLHLLREGLSVARRVIEELVDDLDGKDASETVRFSYRGRDYEIDLSKKNAAAFDKALAPYVDAARKVKSTRPARRSKTTGGGPNPQDVRAWAASQGIEVSDRGRVSAEVIRQYQEAQG